MANKFLDDVGVKYLWGKTTAKIEEEVGAVEAKLASVYTFKGSVDNLSALKALQSDTLAVGDVYNVKDTGMNYAWTGEDSDYDEGWDPLGGTFTIPTLTTGEIDSLLTED